MLRYQSTRLHHAAGRGAGRRRGMASLLAMLFLVVFSAMAVGFYAQATMSAQLSTNERRVRDAQVAAEEGITFIKYHLSALDVPRLAPAQLMEEIYMQLAGRLDGTDNVGGIDGAIAYDDVRLRIEIPAGRDNYVRTPGGSGFKVFIDMNTDRSLKVSSVGRYGAKTSAVGRGIEVTYNPQQKPAPLLGYGVAGRGPVTVGGNGIIRGVPDPSFGSLLITSTTNPALTMTGPSEISGDVYLTNPAATTSINAGCSIGGTTDPILRATHIKKIATVPEFPTIDTDVFRPFITSTYTLLSGNRLRNCRIPANTGTALLPLNLASGATIDGILFVETPNVINFSGTCTIRGLIVSQTPFTGTLATNQLRFSGQVTAFDASTLDPSFGAIRNFTGSSIICPGFNVQFTGGYAAISGTIASSQLSFSGHAGGNISGHVIGVGNQVLTVTGNSEVFLQRPATNQWPAGVFFRSWYGPANDSYIERPANLIQPP